MKVLVFIGTTRKNGDNYRLIQVLAERMNRIEKVEFEYLYLEDLHLEYCRGCCACFSKGEEYCPDRKITAAVEAAIARTDGVILASPVYAHQVTGLTKNFLDHLAYLFHRPRFFEKAALVISTTGGTGLKETLGYLKFTAAGWGVNLLGSLGVIQSAWDYSQAYRDQKLKEIDTVAARMVTAMKTRKRPKPRLSDLIFFRSMRLKAGWCECDRKYWEERGWFKKPYFLDVPLNPVYNAVAVFIEVLIRSYTLKVIKEK